MSRIVYVNGAYQPYGEAAVHVEDRGFQFGDAIYEVIEVLGGQMVDATRHLDRLDRSLAETRIPSPMSRGALRLVMAEVLRRNRVRNGTLYLQVSRGAGRRDFALPKPGTPPTLVMIARSVPQARFAAQAAQGIGVQTMPDIRWGRCDIKTVMLLPAVLAKDAAKIAGAQEAWLIDEAGNITEGASSNAWIVTASGELVTRPLSPELLAGVTRATVFDTARGLGLRIAERKFSRQEALAAREAFITAASNTVMPVVTIDGQAIGDGKPGPVAVRLRSSFHQYAEFSAF